MSDRDTIEAFKSGDDLAFALLYNQYKTGIYTFCLKMLLDRDAALDVVQDTFVRVYENRERLLSSAAFRSWLYTIARNQCLNRLRRSNRLLPIEDRGHGIAILTNNPASELEKAERHRIVNEFLSRLSASYREVIILREYHNMSYADIAAITRSTVSSVKSRLFKARRQLANHIRNSVLLDSTTSNFRDSL